MKCPSCGNIAPDTDKVCELCGHIFVGDRNKFYEYKRKQMEKIESSSTFPVAQPTKKREKEKPQPQKKTPPAAVGATEKVRLILALIFFFGTAAYLGSLVTNELTGHHDAQQLIHEFSQAVSSGDFITANNLADNTVDDNVLSRLRRQKIGAKYMTKVTDMSSERISFRFSDNLGDIRLVLEKTGKRQWILVVDG